MSDKIFVPMELHRINAGVFYAVSLCETQAEADKQIKKYWPQYKPRPVRRSKTSGDPYAQAAGSYSLDLCQGGARYHAVAARNARQSVMGAPTLSSAVFEVDEPHKAPESKAKAKLNKQELAKYRKSIGWREVS